MRVWGLGAIAFMVASTNALSQMKGDPREAIIKSRNVIVDNWDLIAPRSSKLDITKAVDDMQHKGYIELFLIKNADEQAVCQVAGCYNLDAKTIIRLADSVLGAREKEEQMRAARINSYISISSAIVAVLSLLISALSAINTWRGKKANANS